MLAATQPNNNGVIVIPACIAFVPNTDCTNNGVNEIKPYNAQPVNKPCAIVAKNKRSRNNEIGTIGSDARTSTHTNKINNTIETPIKIKPSDDSNSKPSNK